MIRKNNGLKVVLIDPPPRRRIERHDVRDHPHLGLAYIAAYLKSKGVNCSSIDGKFERVDMQEVRRRLCLLSPDIVGVTAMTHEISQASHVAEMAKKDFPGVLTVVGGPHATALPAQTLVQYPAFDVAVFGEGEYTFLELALATASNKSFENIKGIVYRTTNGIHQNEPREPINNLDELPFPAWELYPKSKVYPLITARGCPFRCNFCMRVMGNRVRKRTPHNVVAELQGCVNTYSPKLIHFMDETFTLDKRYLNELLDLMREKGVHQRIEWDAQTRPDFCDYELLRKMKATGCTWIGLGIESGNEKILRASGKGTTLNQVTNAVKAVKKAGLKIDGYFILGHPFETFKTAKDTIDLATKLNTTRATFGLMTPYPGTEIFEMARDGRGGYRLLSNNPQGRVPRALPVGE